MTNESERLAEELMSISYLDLSEVDLGQTELLMTDHLGVTIHGVATPWGRALQKWAATYDNTGNCHLGDMWRIGGRAGFRRYCSCTYTHDKFTSDRSRNPRMAVSGASA